MSVCSFYINSCGSIESKSRSEVNVLPDTKKPIDTTLVLSSADIGFCDWLAVLLALCVLSYVMSHCYFFSIGEPDLKLISSWSLFMIL